MARSRSKTRRAPHSYPRGTLVVHAEGYGFVRTAEGEYFIPSAKLGGAFDGDTVEVSPLPASSSKAHKKSWRPALHSGGRPAARVVRVLERAHEQVIGRYEVADPFGVVVPEDPRIPYDIFTQRSAAPDIPHGALVRVRIATYPSRNTAATGVVEEVLGEANESRWGVESIIARHGIEARFSEEGLREAARLTLDAEKALNDGYADLRAREVCTIDPPDARDFDDALSLDPVDAEAPAESKGDLAEPSSFVLCGKGWEGAGRPVWRLGVHIADVSSYVLWGSPLDLDARNRATSVYLVDRVIPMLPEELSCELCSLRPNEPRLAMTVDLYLDSRARVASYRIYPSVICSKARLAYGQVQELLEGGEPSSADIPDRMGRRLRCLSEIAEQRARLRHAAGALDFPSAEAKVRLDSEGRPLGVSIRKKTEATSLVEQAMILANEAVARYLLDVESPGLFRVHERPAADSLAALVPLFEEFPWFADIDKTRFALGDPHALQACLKASANRSESELVGSLLLRAMKRADYRPQCAGHYGLALSAYAHFTSPIRRYPDLIVHRMLKACLYGRPELYDQEVSALSWLARHCSERERRADDAARESQELKLIELLEAHVGEAFSAVVSGVASYGLYVRLDSTAEGLVPIRRLGSEYFALDADLHRLVGQDSGRVWRLGQRIAVVLTVADSRRRLLEFRLAGKAAD